MTRSVISPIFNATFLLGQIIRLTSFHSIWSREQILAVASRLLRLSKCPISAIGHVVSAKVTGFSPLRCSISLILSSMTFLTLSRIFVMIGYINVRKPYIVKWEFIEYSVQPHRRFQSEAIKLTENSDYRKNFLYLSRWALLE